MSGWPTGVTHRYFLHPDSIRISRNAVPDCNKLCKKFLTKISYINLKNSYIGFCARYRSSRGVSEVEKYKVEHLSFMRHEKLPSNSSWASRSSTKPDVRIFEPDVRILCKKFLTPFITGRYGIPKMSVRVKVQDISMGDTPESPRHIKPSVDTWFSLLGSFAW